MCVNDIVVSQIPVVSTGVDVVQNHHAGAGVDMFWPGGLWGGAHVGGVREPDVGSQNLSTLPSPARVSPLPTPVVPVSDWGRVLALTCDLIPETEFPYRLVQRDRSVTRTAVSHIIDTEPLCDAMSAVHCGSDVMVGNMCNERTRNEAKQRLVHKGGGSVVQQSGGLAKERKPLAWPKSSSMGIGQGPRGGSHRRAKSFDLWSLACQGHERPAALVSPRKPGAGKRKDTYAIRLYGSGPAPWSEPHAECGVSCACIALARAAECSLSLSAVGISCDQHRIGCPHVTVCAFTCTGGEGSGWCCFDCDQEWWDVACTCPPDDLTGDNSRLGGCLRLRGSGPTPSTDAASTLGNRVLLLFSGPRRGEDGLAASLKRFGFDPNEVDILCHPALDLYTNDDLFQDLVVEACSGAYCAMIAAPPCGTFSVARLPIDGNTNGPGQVRGRSPELIEGLPGLSASAATRVAVANVLVERTVKLATIVYRSGGVFLIENPVDRGDVSTPFYRDFWSEHASMWLMPCIAKLRSVCLCSLSTFAQCGLGSPYQKYTSVLYSSELHVALNALLSAVCTHETHDAVAFGMDADGTFLSTYAARYPRAMNLVLAEAVSRVRPPGGRRILSVGSAIPHANSTAIACLAIPTVGPASSASIRRLQRETQAVLIAEAMPFGNVPVFTTWENAPVESRVPPEPLTTVQLIPGTLLDQLVTFRVQLARCAAAARSGRWQYARGLRPQPIYASKEQCCLPAGQGWSWWRKPGGSLWHPMLPSSYPFNLPESNVNARAVVLYAEKHNFPDMQIISWLAHGMPGPAMDYHTLIGAFHVGALQHFSDYEKCEAKDRLGEYGASGESLPTIWPMLADPTNLVHARSGKARMTVDKTITLADGVTSYNDAVLEDEHLRNVRVTMVKLQELGRGHAILQTSDQKVKFWGFDLQSYFRKMGVQKTYRWQSGTTRADGFGDDRRVQFGMREAMDTTGRVTVFNVFAIRTELARLDRSYSPLPLMNVEGEGETDWFGDWIAQRVNAWQQTRASDSEPPRDLQTRIRLMTQHERQRWLALSVVLMFVDDVGGSSVDDLLYRTDGTPWSIILSSGALKWHSRADLHFEAAVGVMQHFGFDEAPGKSWHPCTDMIFLGMLFDGGREMIVMTDEKRVAYATSIAAICRGNRTQGGAVIVEHSTLNTITHQLLHAASVMVLGRQHLYYVRQALHARNRLGGSRCLLHEKAMTELRWWSAQLARGKPCGVPFASRSSFPKFDTPGILVTYSDASREVRARQTESGFGSWTVLGDTLYYLEGRWSVPEIYLLSINVLELKAMNMGLFTFYRLALDLEHVVTEICEFTDNTAAQHSAHNGTGHTERMVYLVAERYDMLVHADAATAVVRIASVDNDLADGLSRGGVYLADALRLAAASGLKIRRVIVPPDVRCTDALRRMIQIAPNVD